MSRAATLLISLFERAWGPSLTELVRAEDAPLGLPQRALAELRSLAPELATGPELGDAIRMALLRWLWSRNQFLAIDAEAEAELGQSVARVLARLAASEEPSAALARHRDELARFVRARLGDAPREVVSAEYSPALQLALLGLSGAELKPPLLDLGCGPNARLVRSLRARGLSATGIDRVAPADVAGAGDWLAYEYGSARWGCVLSHLGFSLHFLRAHLSQGDEAYAYARAYMAILRSLQPGGLFAYAPGLPFIEPLLEPGRYRVRRVHFADALHVASLKRAEAATGLPLGSATQVERVG